MTNDTGVSLTFKQKIFLALIVPALMLMSLELVCRFFRIAERLSPLNEDIQLEMPTWMTRDDNGMARAAKILGNRNTVDWLSMFEDGPGFRVRLIPNIERSVTNTFSRIKADREKKYFVKANSLGFRGAEVSANKDTSTFRVIVFGDSSSFGWGVNQDESFSALLPQLLAKIDAARFKQVEVANFAIPGDSSEYGKLILESFIPPYEADIAILGFGANDAKKVFVPHTAQVERFRSNKTLQTVRYLASYSALYRTFDAIVAKSKQAASTGKQAAANRSAVNRKRYVENLSTMSSRAKINGVGNVLLLNLCTPPDYAKKARELAQTEGYLYLNGQAHLLKHLKEIKNGQIHSQLVEEMKKSYGTDLEKNSSFYVTSDACHPNKLGHLMVAEELARIIAAS